MGNLSDDAIRSRRALGAYEAILPYLLLFVRNRAYDIDSGRWQSRDPYVIEDIDLEAEATSALDLYEYASSSPVNLLDPYGLYSVPIVPGTRRCRHDDCKTSEMGDCRLRGVDFHGGPHCELLGPSIGASVLMSDPAVAQWIKDNTKKDPCPSQRERVNPFCKCRGVTTRTRMSFPLTGLSTAQQIPKWVREAAVVVLGTTLSQNLPAGCSATVSANARIKCTKVEIDGHCRDLHP